MLKFTVVAAVLAISGYLLDACPREPISTRHAPGAPSVVVPVADDSPCQNYGTMLETASSSCEDGQHFDGHYGSCVETPLLEEKIKPDYPPSLRFWEREGAVILEVVVNTDGSVEDIAVIKNPSGYPGFETAAAAAMEHWRYRPATINGSPVRACLRVKIDFVLE